jgi:hypothetical protein
MKMMQKMKRVVAGNGITASAESRGSACSAGDAPARVGDDAVRMDQGAIKVVG